MKKNIAFFLFKLAGGGAERTVVNILNNLDRSKYNIFLILGTDIESDYLNQIKEDVIIHKLHKKKLRYCIFSLSKAIKKYNPDIIFTTMYPNIIITSLSRIISNTKAKLIVRESSNRSSNKKNNSLNYFLTRVFYNNADKVISLSQGVKDDLVNNFKINKDKIKVIYNPIDIKNIKRLAKEEILDFDFNDRDINIISVGRLTEQKDYPTLLKFFSEFNKDINSKLIILGKGSDEYMLKSMCNDLNISDRVFFLGFKDNPYKYIKKCDVFILTSKWEGFGHVIVESMTLGTPVIVSDCKSGPSEILNNGEFGMLSKVGDYQSFLAHAKELINNEYLYNNYSKLAISRANDFDVLKIVKQYEAVFDHITES